MVRRYFISICAAILAASLFTACDDDDKSMVGDFSGKYAGRESSFMIGEIFLPSDGKNLVIEPAGDNRAMVTLSNVVPDRANLTVEVSAVVNDGKLAFEGESEIEGCQVSLKGSVSDGKASVVVNRKMLIPFIGDWKLKFNNVAGKRSAAIYLSVKTVKPEMDMMINTMGAPVVGQLMAKSLDELKVSLSESGIIGLSWKKVGESEAHDLTSLAKILSLQYCVINHKLMIAVDKNYMSMLTALGGDLLAKYGIKMDELMALLVDLGGYYAIPLSFGVNGGNEVLIFADKQLVLPLVNMAMPIVAPMIPSGFEETVKAIMALLPTSERVDLGLIMEKQ